MNESNATDIEKGIGSEVAQFVYRVPKKNHDAMMQLNKQFVDTMRKYGAAHLIFQLTNTEAPMEGITNIAKTVSANQDEEDEVDAKMRNDENMAPLFQQSVDLLTPGTSFIMGEFSRLKI
jgi:Protein of unknown function (DUF1428)